MKLTSIELIWLSAFIFVYLGQFFDSIMDTVVHHPNNIFKRINQDKHPALYKYCNLDVDWWRRKYTDKDPSKWKQYWLVGRFKITKPACFFDLWHSAKIVKQWMHYNVLFVCQLPVLIMLLSLPGIITVYFLEMILYSCVIVVSHDTWYENLLKEN